MELETDFIPVRANSGLVFSANRRIWELHLKPKEYVWFYLSHEGCKGMSGWKPQEAEVSKSFGESDFCFLKVAQLKSAMTGVRAGLRCGVGGQVTASLGSLPMKDSGF